MKKIIYAMLLALFCLPCVSYAENEDIEAQIEYELSQYDLSAWDDYFKGLPENIQSVIGSDAQSMIEGYAAGEANSDYNGTLENVKNMLLSALKENIFPLALIVAISALSGLAGVLTDDSVKKTGENAVAFICTGLCVLLLMHEFSRISAAASAAVYSLTGFTEATTPVLAAMIAAAGSVGTSGMLSPLSVFLNTTVVGMFENIIMPLTLSSAAIASVGALTHSTRMAHLLKLIKTVLKWIIGLVFTVYLGMLTVQGIAAYSADSIALKSAKFALDKSVPVVGSVVSGTLSTVMSCAGMIKNAAGISAVLISCAYVLSPLLCIGGATLAFRIGAALCETVADGAIPSLLSSLADVCNYLFAAVVATGIMFMITLGLCIMVGG